MGIFDRMGKVISSNVNSLLDKAEDDEKLVHLSLDEMKEQLKAARQEVVSAVAVDKQLKKRSADLEAEAEKWDKRAELALRTGDEALAREALKQKKRARTEADHAEKARLEARDHALKLKAELERMEAKHEELSMRKGTLVSRAQQTRQADENGSGGSAFANFKALEEKIEGREQEGLAMAEVEAALKDGPSDRDLDAKFRALEKGDGGVAGGKTEIDDELEALKKRIRI
jgi:phage shock protein A